MKLLQDRTALYLTAEKGSAETAQFLLDIGAPIGVYDSNGVSALACLIERIPNVAYRALEQYQTNNISLKQSRMYLSHLETDTTAKKGSCRLRRVDRPPLAHPGVGAHSLKATLLLSLQPEILAKN